MKKSNLKNTLKRDRVESESFHVGIELELKADGSGERHHDDEGCLDSYLESLRSSGPADALRNYFSVGRTAADSLEDYFNFDAWLDAMAESYECNDDGCSYWSGGEDDVRETLCENLRELTGNSSFKVVSDGSIQCDGEEIDAEVCWNYFASKETVRDNAKILKHLKDAGCRFDTSCGLHINLNNYLKVPAATIETDQLSFLFDFVAASRRNNNYCRRYGMATGEKYSMIYHQGDRLEFRFFSPTLEAEKLNMYVHLANVVYRRLAGKNAHLSRKAVAYFMKKMVEVNKLTAERAAYAIAQVNSIRPALEYQPIQTVDVEENGGEESILAEVA